MEVTPQSVASATFRVGRKGYEPDEVRAYLATVARALSDAQDRANHMESRARQAVARIQEMQAAQAPRLPEGSKLDDTATISRTLLLAQKTADDTIAQARIEADQFRVSARAEAESIVSQAHVDAAAIVDAARDDARSVSDAEQLRAEAELQESLVRLRFLRDDVKRMEDFTIVQRNRLLEASAVLRDVAERPVGGLGELRPPSLRGDALAETAPSGIYGSLQDSWPEPMQRDAQRSYGATPSDDFDHDVVDFDDLDSDGSVDVASGADEIGDVDRYDGEHRQYDDEPDGDVDDHPLLAFEVPGDFADDEIEAVEAARPDAGGFPDDATAAVPAPPVPPGALAGVPDAPGLNFADEITAEVPVFQRPQPPSGGMRILGDE